MMITADLPPTVYAVPRFVQQIELDPDRYEADPTRFVIAGRNVVVRDIGTSNVPAWSRNGARALGSPWLIHTSSSSIDRAVHRIGVVDLPPPDVPSQLAEVKRLTGFGWDKLADLLGCTRQAVHRWMQGGPVKDANCERLAKLRATVLFIDRGNSEANRALLSQPVDGHILSDLLAVGRYDDAMKFAGKGSGRPNAKWGNVEGAQPEADENWFAHLAVSDEPESDVGLFRQGTKRLQLRKG